MYKCIYVFLSIILTSFVCADNSRYIECTSGEVRFVAEISCGEKEQVVLANAFMDDNPMPNARIWIDNVPLNSELPLTFSGNKRFSSIRCKLALHYAVTSDLDKDCFDVLVDDGKHKYFFQNIKSFTIPENEEDSLLEPEPDPVSDPLELDFEDIRIELGGGIKVIHGKIYDFTQMDYHGIARVRGKTKKYNPLCVFGVGSIDFSGNASVFIYSHSFKGNRNLESVVEVDGYSPLIFIHTGVRYRFAKYASTKTTRALVNKSGGPIANLKLTINYEFNGQTYNFAMPVQNFESFTIDLNPYFQLNPVLGFASSPLATTIKKEAIEFPEEKIEAEPRITILNTSSKEIKNLKLTVSFTSGKGNQNKEVTFDPLGEEEVVLE